MERSEFNYRLPESLIAQEPLAVRSASRLLLLNGSTGQVEDRRFPGLLNLLQPGDLLVFNDTRVMPARLLARKPTGGQVEVLLERITGPCSARAQLRSSGTVKQGSELLLPANARGQVLDRRGDFFEILFDRAIEPYLNEHGQVPLPPYITRPSKLHDRERYQTIFSRRPGAVAAPTAGLHFDQQLLDALVRHGVELAYLTLHVGAGTFSPVRCQRVEDHRVHAEWLEVTDQICNKITDAHTRGKRVVAVGTTTVRALETAARNGVLQPFTGETSLFVYPGFRFRVVDALVTNFHLPESSLLMLVAAFAGREKTLVAYDHAVSHGYRFFSYGDAMFVTLNPGARLG